MTLRTTGILLAAWFAWSGHAQDTLIDTNAPPPPTPLLHPVPAVLVQSGADGLALENISTSIVRAAIAARCDALPLPAGRETEIVLPASAVQSGFTVSSSFAGGRDMPDPAGWFFLKATGVIVPGEQGFLGGERVRLDDHFDLGGSVIASTVVWQAVATTSTAPVALTYTNLVHLEPRNRFWRFMAEVPGGTSPTNDLTLRDFSFTVLPAESAEVLGVAVPAPEPVPEPVAVPAASLVPAAPVVPVAPLTPAPKKKRGFFGV